MNLVQIGNFFFDIDKMECAHYNELTETLDIRINEVNNCFSGKKAEEMFNQLKELTKMNEICKCQCEYQTCKVEITNEVSTPKYCIAYPEKQAYWKTVSAGVPKIENAKVEIPNLGNIPSWIKDGIEYELYWAIDTHPEFPTDPFQAICLIHEELGEATQALNDFIHHNKATLKDVNIELLHTIVTCIRMLVAIGGKEDSR